MMINDDQSEAQPEQSQIQTVQSEHEIGPTEAHTVVDDALKEHERDDPQTVDVNAGNGKEVHDGVPVHPKHVEPLKQQQLLLLLCVLSL